MSSYDGPIKRQRMNEKNVSKNCLNEFSLKFNLVEVV